MICKPRRGHDPQVENYYLRRKPKKLTEDSLALSCMTGEDLALAACTVGVQKVHELELIRSQALQADSHLQTLKATRGMAVTI